jgi:hypothetical protein
LYEYENAGGSQRKRKDKNKKAVTEGMVGNCEMLLRSGEDPSGSN